MMHKVSIIQPLPISYHAADRRPRRASTLVTHCTWFGGIYQDTPNQFAVIAGRARAVPARCIPEFKLPPDQMKAWLGRSPGRHRRPRHRRRASAGRSATAFRSRRTIWQPKQRQRPGSSTSSASTTATRASTRRSSSSATTTSTRTAATAQGNDRLVSSIKVARSVAVGDDGRRRSTRSSRTRRRRPRPRPRRRSSQGFANQVGDIGAIITGDPRRRVLHDPAGRGQHDGAVGARAHERARGAEDAGLPERPDPGAGARRVDVPGGARRRHRARARRWLLVSLGSFDSAMLPVFFLHARHAHHGRRLGRRCSGCVAGALPAMAAMRLRITDALRRN